MDYKTSEVLEFIEENDVKFIKLAFCDIFGNQKNRHGTSEIVILQKIGVKIGVKIKKQ